MRPLLLVWLVVLIAAPIAAAVLVPDPSWVGGVYDSGDSDAVVQLLWDLAGGIVPIVALPAALPGSRHDARPVIVAFAARPAARADCRAPPIA